MLPGSLSLFWLEFELKKYGLNPNEWSCALIETQEPFLPEGGRSLLQITHRKQQSFKMIGWLHNQKVKDLKVSSL